MQTISGLEEEILAAAILPVALVDLCFGPD